MFIKDFTKFTGKQLCWSLFFSKVSGLTPATLLKRRLQQKCFPTNFVKFLEHLFYKTLHDDFFILQFISQFHFAKKFYIFIQTKSVRKIDKNSQFCHLFILQIRFILSIVNDFIDQNVNTRSAILVWIGK